MRREPSFGESSLNPAIRVIPTIFALTAFATAVYAGLAAGNTGVVVLSRALVAMVVSHLVGIPIASIASFAITEHAKQYRTKNPIPDAVSSGLVNLAPTSGSGAVVENRR